MTILQPIKVGMADMQVTGDRDAILKTTGLGSCVGLTLHDAAAGVAGMAHIMLPSANIAREGNMNKAKYADTAIPELIRRMTSLGASVSRMTAKMAGGAQMFQFAGSDTMRIGPRNVEMCKELLGNYHIPLTGEDTGANYGRTIEYYCGSGKLVIRSVMQGVKEL